MNAFVSSPDLAMTLARRTIADRVDDAQARTVARSARRSTVRQTDVAPATPRRLRWRFAHSLHLAH